MEKYHGIAIAKDVHFGIVPVFYMAEHEDMYHRDVSIGRLADNDNHVVLDSVWLDRPVDYESAWKLAEIMLNNVPEETGSGIPGTYGLSVN